MQGLFNFISSSSNGDAISDCAKALKDLKKMRVSYPPEEKQTTALCINLKAYKAFVIINKNIV